MIFSDKRFFLFKCDNCDAILDINLDEVEDIETYHEDKLKVECSCGGNCQPLRD
jgi:hypothetical protein